MGAEIVPLGKTYFTGQPNEAIVAKLREVLEQAERGEVVAFAMARIDGGGTTITGWIGGSAPAGQLVGGAALLLHRITKATDELE